VCVCVCVTGVPILSTTQQRIAITGKTLQTAFIQHQLCPCTFPPGGEGKVRGHQYHDNGWTTAVCVWSHCARENASLHPSSHQLVILTTYTQQVLSAVMVQQFGGKVRLYSDTNAASMVMSAQTLPVYSLRRSPDGLWPVAMQPNVTASTI